MSINFSSQCTHKPGLFPSFASQTTTGLTGDASANPLICMAYDYTATAVFIFFFVVAVGFSISWVWSKLFGQSKAGDQHHE